MNTPKFKEGDWIKSKRHGKVAQVIMLLRDCYSLKTLDNDGLWLDYNFQDTWELIKEPSEKPINQDEDLNKEIKAFVNEYGYEKSEDILLIATVARHFAEWQKEQDEKEQADLFTIVALDAAQRAKEQILKGAVEGKIAERVQGKLYARCQVPKTMGVEFGDKVRVIIVKE